ncbi:MAG TPA: hypothetical protein VFD49_14135 [Candidatus Dormibacteraeota bacterium]|nr:hypothetical protein [Candidatus Dormibacteraeota bacterium]
MLVALAVWVMVACGAESPISPAACAATRPQRTGSLLKLVASPAESDISGLVSGSVTATAGRPLAVRWLVDLRKASDVLQVQAVREGTRQVYRESVPSGGVVGTEREFPSRLVFPAPGCWDTELISGTADGTVVFKVT